MINNVELKEIFNAIRDKEENAFKNLYEKYNKLVFGVAFSICKNNADSEDITQNVFSKIYSLDVKKLPTNGEVSWLYMVSKNESISFLRKKHNNINMDEIYEIEEKSNDIEDIIDKQTFKKLISGLNDKEKEIMSLKILADLSFDEIGKILNEPVGTVKWRYYKSANFLKLSLSSISMFIIAFIIGINSKIKKNTNKLEEKNYYEKEENVGDSNISNSMDFFYSEEKNFLKEDRNHIKHY